MFGFDLTAEQQELKELARKFAREEIIPVASTYDEEERFPGDICRKAWELGLMNLEVPKEYGGLGLGVLDAILILEELNYGCAGVTNALAANGLAATPLLIAGSDAQKQEYLGRLAHECSFAAFCTTEPGAASDVAGMTTTYRKVGDEYVLNGVKHFISNGTVASWYVVFATKDKQLKHKGISCFVFPADLPGIRKQRMHHKLGQRAADEATRYALERQQFGQPIANFQAIQFMLADMAIDVEAMRLLTYKAAWMIDQGAPASIVSSYAKAFGADATMRITTDAVQVFGGYGYMKEYPVEKLMRDAKLLQIYEGTSQIQRVVIARNLLKQ